MSSQDKIKKGQRISAFCGHFMAEWDEHHYCPKCRDDLKGDDPCANSQDCVICSTFSEDQKKKLGIETDTRARRIRIHLFQWIMAVKKGVLMILC